MSCQFSEFFDNIPGMLFGMLRFLKASFNAILKLQHHLGPFFLPPPSEQLTTQTNQSPTLLTLLHVVVPALLLLFMFSLTSLDLASPCKYQIFKIIFKAMANFRVRAHALNSIFNILENGTHSLPSFSPQKRSDRRQKKYFICYFQHFLFLTYLTIRLGCKNDIFQKIQPILKA